ncbi:MAG TPA: helix-hairpin-helix domain-containing protein, partial [Acidimicrobiia bacterium]
GEKKRMLDLAGENARTELARKLASAGADREALEKLRRLVDLPKAETPPVIDCFDVSNLQGTHVVASRVRFRAGIPDRAGYRRFRVRGVDGQDDFASMEETIRRRFQAYLRERERSAEQGKFSYPPSLVVIDGGVGQLGRAVKVMDELGIDIPVIGLAKRMEEVYLPGQPEPVRIPRNEEALYLLQQVRDEAHRFAVTYHRTLRSKSMVDSLLDEVEGVGPGRKKALTRRFGSLKKMREASRDELAEVVPAGVAERLYEALHR